MLSATQARKVIEALRCGVPNGHAVEVLGCHQPEINRQFQARLATTSICPLGLIIKGGFGAGKSHVLEYLHGYALKQNFVCSRITINKESPLHDPVKLYRAAAESAAVPNRFGNGIKEVAGRANRASPAYRDLRSWTRLAAVDARLGASLQIFESPRADAEIQDQMLQFWTGEPIGAAAIRQRLHQLQLESGRSLTLSCVTQRELGLQRFQFISRLIRAAGFKGWVLLIDEVELIGCYSLLQRAKSYAELARFSGASETFTCPGLVTVFAITDDFDAAVLKERGDITVVPSSLRDRHRPGEEDIVRLAPLGMTAIRKNGLPLVAPGDAEVSALYEKVKQLYADAYSCDQPDVAGPDRLSSTRLRQFVKRWITEWDMRRLYPDQQVELYSVEVSTDYSEDTTRDDNSGPLGDALMDELLGRIIRD